jgi:hypothetical protein
MRTAYAIAVCLFAFAALGGGITSLDPPSILTKSGEYFMTFNGTDLKGLVTYDGPAGTFELETNADYPGSVVAWVPMDVVNTPGTYYVTVGDSNKVSFNVYKPGRPLLSLHLPELITALAKTRLGNIIDYEVNAIGGEGEIVTECDPKSGSTFPYGESTIRCIAYDQAGGKVDGVISVKVWDGTPPQLSIPKSFEVDAEDEKGAYVKFDASAIDEIDGGVRVTCSKESGALFENGRNVVNCEAGDEALNLGTGSFEVFVKPRDPGRLELKVPDKVTEVANPEWGGAEVIFDVVPYGSADPDPVVVCQPASGSSFSIGTWKVYCTAEDDFGSRAEAGFEVEVVERYGMKFPDVTAEATSPTGTEVTWEAPEGWTNAITCTPSAGMMFSLGATSVDCESTDAQGRRAGGKFTVNVADTIAPHIGKVRANAGSAANGRVPVQVEVEAIDAADAMPRCTIATLAADAGGAFDWRVKSELEVEVRADARPFRIQVSCVDASGNRATGSVPVTLSGTPRYRPISQ